MAGSALIGKVVRDLMRLPANAGRFEVQAAVWRSVTRHTRGADGERIAEITWQVLRGIALRGKAA